VPSKRRSHGPNRRPVDDERERSARRRPRNRAGPTSMPLAQAVREMDAAMNAASLSIAPRRGIALLRDAWMVGAEVRLFEERMLEGRHRAQRLITGCDVIRVVDDATEEAIRLLTDIEDGGRDLSILPADTVAILLEDLVHLAMRRACPGLCRDPDELLLIRIAARGYCTIALLGGRDGGRGAAR
jgi:hypothetical protein